MVQKLLVGALLWAAAPIGQEVALAGGGSANQGPSLVFCWFLGTIKVLRPSGSGKYLSCILCKFLDLVRPLFGLPGNTKQPDLDFVQNQCRGVTSCFLLCIYISKVIIVLCEIPTIRLNQKISKGRV